MIGPKSAKSRLLTGIETGRKQAATGQRSPLMRQPLPQQAAARDLRLRLWTESRCCLKAKKLGSPLRRRGKAASTCEKPPPARAFVGGHGINPAQQSSRNSYNDKPDESCADKQSEWQTERDGRSRRINRTHAWIYLRFQATHAT